MRSTIQWSGILMGMVSGDERQRRTMFVVRYVLPAVVVLAGIVVLALDPTIIGLEGWALLTGAGLSILLLNWLYRVGVKGDEERDVEEAARVYFDEHGRWPDDE